jgi:hypothetical protein
MEKDDAKNEPPKERLFRVVYRMMLMDLYLQ